MEQCDVTDLFTPARLGELELANRVVMAPMTRNRAGPNDVPTDHMVEYYRQRATAGLIVTEGTHPSRAGKGYFRTPGIHEPAQIAGWRRVADAVHRQGGRIVLQLMHCGRACVRANKAPDAETIAPSAIRCRDKIPGPDGTRVEVEMPRALQTHEVVGVIEEYARAALNARAAGLDGVELHCTSGYLPMQFLSTGTNHRTDRYGGSVQNRIRFVVEALEAIAAAIGPGRVGFRIFPGNPFNDMQEEDPGQTYAALLRAVNGLGLAYVHLIHAPTGVLDSLSLVKSHWSAAVIVNNNFNLESARALLVSGQADAVSFARLFISNPDLVERFRRGAPLTPPDRSTFYIGEDTGYTDYPTLDGQPGGAWPLQGERSCRQ
jgi:N-ethylmaleimide reductase